MVEGEVAVDVNIFVDVNIIFFALITVVSQRLVTGGVCECMYCV